MASQLPPLMDAPSSSRRLRVTVANSAGTMAAPGGSAVLGKSPLAPIHSSNGGAPSHCDQLHPARSAGTSAGAPADGLASCRWARTRSSQSRAASRFRRLFRPGSSPSKRAVATRQHIENASKAVDAAIQSQWHPVALELARDARSLEEDLAQRAWMSADEGAAAAVRIRQLTTRYAALHAGVGTSTAAGTPGCFYFTLAP